MKTQDSKRKEILTTIYSKREVKRSINIKPRTVRYFQFGLLVGLFAVLIILEANIGFRANSFAAPKEVNLNDEPAYIFTIEKKNTIAKVEEPVKRKVAHKKLLTEIFKTTINDAPLIDTPSKPTIDVVTAPIVTPTATTPLKTVSKNVLNVEFVPVFPGCEGFSSNKDKVACMSSKINDFIGRNFKTNDFDHLEQGDVFTIHTFFTINTEGFVTGIKARVADKELEKEAMRVLSQLPPMKAGKQGNKPVNVQYSIPITFRVSN